LFGPTGLGKTEIAMRLAELIDGEIVSADSMQVYRGLEVLTNQPTADQLRRVPHHLVAVVDPSHDFSVAEYAQLAGRAVDDILARGRRVVLEGGAGLYLRAALGGLTFGAAHDAALRAELEAKAAGDVAALRAELARRDPETAARIDLANPRRVMRALDTILLQDAPLSAEQRDVLWAPAARYTHRLFALVAERAELRRRIDERVLEMVAAGLVDEVMKLRALPHVSRTLAQAIGVREFGDYLDGACSQAEAIAATQARTRRYVRRQLTWMRKLQPATIATTGRSPGEVAAELRRRLGRAAEPGRQNASSAADP
jgi:tRNA dimethylallyltransferase